MRDIIPEYFEGWEGLRDFLISIGIPYAHDCSLLRAWRRMKIPYERGVPCVFRREHIKAFIYRHTGVSSGRWISQREEDIKEGRETSVSNLMSGECRAPMKVSTILWIATVRKKRLPWILREPSGMAYATRNRIEAETWDTSVFPGNIQIWEMTESAFDSDRMVGMARMKTYHKTFSVFAPLVYMPGGLNFPTVGGEAVGEMCPQTAAVVTTGVPREIRVELIKVIAKTKTPHQWVRWWNPKEVKPVTLDPVPKHERLPTRMEVFKGLLDEESDSVN